MSFPSAARDLLGALSVAALALGCANGLEPTDESTAGSGASGPGSGGLGGAGTTGSAASTGATSSAGTTSSASSTASAGGATASSATSGPASSSAGVGGAASSSGVASSSGAGGSGGACPSSPTNVSGCASCGSLCDAPWNVSWSPTPGVTHYIVAYTCIVPHQYQTMNTVADLCTEVGMCNDDLCANGAGAVTVEACDGACCSAPVTVNPNETPIACGGGLCC